MGFKCFFNRLCKKVDEKIQNCSVKENVTQHLVAQQKVKKRSEISVDFLLFNEL